MIQIDKVSFDFIVPKEEVARSLYSNWDVFCHKCFEQVVEDCWAIHDNENVTYEFEKIEIDLGDIPEENFYEEYPKRLREQLHKLSFPAAKLINMETDGINVEDHVENILHYLKFGTFGKEKNKHLVNIESEIGWLMNQSSRVIENSVAVIVNLIHAQNNAVLRLLEHVNHITFLYKILTTIISLHECRKSDKMRVFMSFLDLRSDIISMFIREADDSSLLYDVAELLDAYSVYKILHTYTYNTTYSSIYSYLYCLYEWLIQYYPYYDNNASGDKSHFITHLNRQLLISIRENRDFSCVSKYELTQSFLLRVFGNDKYYTTLKSIYSSLKEQVKDEFSDHYHKHELYTNLIRLHFSDNLNVDNGFEMDMVQNEREYKPRRTQTIQDNINNNKIDILSDITSGQLSDFLMNRRFDKKEKQDLIRHLVNEQPDIIVRWLQFNAENKNLLLTYCADIVDENLINRLLSSVSISFVEWVKENKDNIINNKNDISWLKNHTMAKVEQSLNHTLILLIAESKESQIIQSEKLYELLFKQLMKVNNSSKNEYQSIKTTKKPFKIKAYRNMFNTSYDVSDSELHTLILQLQSSDDSYITKSRRVAQFWDRHRNSYSKVINVLTKEDMLPLFMCYTSAYAQREIFRQLAIEVFGYNSLHLMLMLFDLLTSRNHHVLSHLKDSDTAITVQIFIWLIRQFESCSTASAEETIQSLFIALFGSDNSASVYEYFVRNIVDEQDGLVLKIQDDNKEDSKLNDLESVSNENMSNDEYEQLRSKLQSSAVSEELKYIYITRFWDRHRDSYSEVINVLTKEDMLPLFMCYTSAYAQREIFRQLAIEVFGYNSLHLMLMLFDLLTSRNHHVLSHLKDSDTAITVQIFIWLIQQFGSSSNALTKETIQSLFIALFGSDNSASVYEYFVESIVDEQDGLALRLPQDKTNIIPYEQKTEKELVNVHGLNNKSLENLTADVLSSTSRNELLNYYVNNNPLELLKYIRKTIHQQQILEHQWGEWIKNTDWRKLFVFISISVSELFIQVIDFLHLEEHLETRLWISLILKYKNDDWYYNTYEENIRLFMNEVYCIQEYNEEKDIVMQKILKQLEIETLDNQDIEIEQPLHINNAGLCLLAPWFVRLFDMLGYLDTERKEFKNTSSKVRAIFLLQYLVYGEEQKYDESDLIFNRLLTDLSVSIPLPKQLYLTDEEKQTADGMIAGVKANWPQMKGTSVSGFRKSFIMRGGILEPQDECWLLTVEENAYDILIDTLPWAFRQLRLPWLKKIIQVSWHDKQII